MAINDGVAGWLAGLVLLVRLWLEDGHSGFIIITVILAPEGRKGTNRRPEDRGNYICTYNY